MSPHDSEETTDTRDEQDSGNDQKQEHSEGDVELSEEGREEVQEMVDAYKDKPTVVLPGTGGTISGTAINEWLDEDGNPKFGDPDEHPFAEEQDESEGSKETSGDGKETSGDGDETSGDGP